MPAPCAAQLNRRVTIESLSQAKDSHGGMVDTWTLFVNVWAQIKNLSGNDKKITAYGGQAGEARTEFTIRYISGLTHKHRISYNGKKYNIQHVNDWNEEHRFMVLTCDTGLNDGR